MAAAAKAKTKFLIASADGTCRLRTGPGTTGMDHAVMPMPALLWGSSAAMEGYVVVSVSSDARAKATELEAVYRTIGAHGRARLHDVRGTHLSDAVLVPGSRLDDLHLLFIGPGDYRVARLTRIPVQDLGTRGRRCASMRPGDLAERIVIGA